MKRGMVCFALITLVLFMAFAAQADGEALPASDEAFLAVLQEYRNARKTEFDIALDKAYFETISADSFAAFRTLEVKAGIKDESLRYSSGGELFFSNVVWEDVPWAECATKDEIREAVLSFTAEKAGAFDLICPPGLMEELRGNGLLYAFAAQGGADDLSLAFGRSGIIYVDGIEYNRRPYAVVSDEQGFKAAVEIMARDGAHEFDIVFEPAFFAELSGNDDMLRVMQASSQMENYRSRRSSYFCRIEYSEVEFSDAPRAVCGTEQDIVEAIRQMGGIGAKSFNLILTEELYNTIHEGYFQRLHELETEAGMTSSSMSYSFSNYILYYTEAAISTDVVKLTTAAEAIDYVTKQAAAGAEEITLFCSDDLYTLLMGSISPLISIVNSDSMAPIYDVAAEAGLFHFSFYYSGTTHIIQIKDLVLYPGAAVINAIRRGDDSGLSAREREAWNAAAALAQACASPDPLTTARLIHDRLCEMIVYIDDESTDEDDTAIGALLNGQANCDGYADAFYLTGTLAGLNVRCQHGDSYSVGLSFDFMNAETHMWNLLEIDGSWRLVDVTWDDDDENGIRYTWFNLGEDRAARMHIWNRETTVALLPQTDLSVRPDSEYLVGSKEDADAAIQNALEKKQDSFEIIFDGEDSASTHFDVLSEISRRAATSFTYSWNDRMLTLTVYGMNG